MKIEEPAREGFLYQIWLNRASHFTYLNSVDGVKIQILEKGVRNYDTGPDFLNALVKINGDMLRGDIEVDPVANDWYAHGHHKNPHYNHVIVHIVTMDCPKEARTVRQDGKQVPIVNLDDFLEKPAEQLEHESDIKEQSIIHQDCALSRQDRHNVYQILERAGDFRLANKTAHFSERRFSSSWNQIFYQSILEALGYSKNQIPFRNLAHNLPIEILWNYLWKDCHSLALLKCEAFLLGCAGFLPTHPPDGSIVSDYEAKCYISRLNEIWGDSPLSRKVNVLKPEMWQFFRLRPHNFPPRRIAAAAVLVLRFMNEGFVETLVKIIMNCDGPRKMIVELEKLLLVESHGFWKNHFYFSDSKNIEITDSRYPYLLGSDRARDIIVNVCFPGLVAYAGETGDGRLQNTVKEFYNHFPRLEENEITRTLRKQLNLSIGRRFFGVRHQQGLIHLKKLLCLATPCNRCLELDAFT
jgi:hypothetical protein